MGDTEGGARGERPAAGIGLALAAFGSAAVMSALAKAADAHASVEVTVFFQNVLCFALVAPAALRGGRAGLATRRIGMHLLRAVTGTGGWLALFFAIGLVPLANAVLLTYSAPIFIPLIAWLVSRQPIGRNIWGGVLLGFVGIALVLDPIGAAVGPGELLALAGAILLALALLSVRWLGETEPILRILFCYFGLASVLMLPVALSNWRTPDGWAWLYIVGIGLTLLASQVFVILAYRAASPVRLAPLIYTVIVFAALIDWAVWGQTPSLLEAAGMLLVIAGGAIAVRTQAAPPPAPL